MVDQTAGKSGSFDMGRVINQTFNALTVKFTATMGAYLLLALVVATASRVGTVSYNLGAVGGGRSLVDGISPALWLVIIPAVIALSVVLVIVRSALVQEVIGRLTSAPVSPAEAFRVGLNRFWPVIGVSLLAGLAMVAGFVLLVVPGFIVAVMLSVYYPIAVTERRGVQGALKRSAELTRGHRWQIFGLGLIYMVVAIVAISIGSAITLVAGGPQTWIGSFIVAICQTGINLVGLAGICALYVELRNSKDGFASETADVFA